MNHRSGFTLIELLIVLGIVGLLASIAYPSYASYTTGARRIEGQTALLNAMQKQERYFADHNTYLAFSSANSSAENTLFPWWSGASAAKSAYELSGEACPEVSLKRCIQLRAVPGTDKVNKNFRDDACQTLTLNSVGQTGASGPKERCWP